MEESPVVRPITIVTGALCCLLCMGMSLAFSLILGATIKAGTVPPPQPLIDHDSASDPPEP
jgi:hypothetical protein